LIRPATAQDIAKFYGAVAVPCRMFAIDIGEVVGVGGLVWFDGGVEAVSWITAEGKARPREVMKLADAVTGLIEETKEQVYAHSDPEEPSSPRFLAYLGFERVAGSLYVFRGVPCWRRVRHAQPAARAVSADGAAVRGPACER
jgi:hypothetical protein